MELQENLWKLIKYTYKWAAHCSQVYCIVNLDVLGKNILQK